MIDHAEGGAAAPPFLHEGAPALAAVALAGSSAPSEITSNVRAFGVERPHSPSVDAAIGAVGLAVEWVGFHDRRATRRTNASDEVETLVALVTGGDPIPESLQLPMELLSTYSGGEHVADQEPEESSEEVPFDGMSRLHEMYYKSAASEADPITSLLKDRDKVNYWRLKHAKKVLKKAGCKPQILHMETLPAYLAPDAQLLNNLHNGNTSAVRAVIEDGMPLAVTPSDIQRVNDVFDKIGKRGARKFKEKPELAQAHAEAVAAARERSLDFDGATERLRSLEDVSVTMTATIPPELDGSKQEELAAQLAIANDALAGVRKACAATVVQEACTDQDLDKLAKMIIGTVFLATALVTLRDKLPHWMTSSAAGDFDDILTWLTLRKAASQKGIAFSHSPGRDTIIQMGAGSLTLGTVSYLNVFIDHFENYHSLYGDSMVGLIFTATALGVAATGNFEIARENGKHGAKSSPNHLVTDHDHTLTRDLKVLRERNKDDDAQYLALAKERTLRSFHEQPTRPNAEWKLKRVTTVEDFEQLLGRPRHTTRQEFVGNRFQRYALTATATAALFDFAFASRLEDHVGLLTGLGSAEDPILLVLCYVSEREAFVRRRNQTALYGDKKQARRMLKSELDWQRHNSLSVILRRVVVATRGKMIS